MINKISLKTIPDSREILLREENFAYFLPCAPLRSCISNFTLCFPESSVISEAYTVLPHGSVTLVLFTYKMELHSFLFGPAAAPVRVGDLACGCDMIFIAEFQPGGFYPFVQISQKELTDKIIPFSFLDLALDAQIRELLITSQTVEELLHETEHCLIRNLRNPYPPELDRAVKEIIRKEGSLTSAELARQIFYTTRHLNRLFNQYLGLSVKSFSRIVRINKAIQLLNEQRWTLEVVSGQLGYADVSHLIKDFRLILNLTPREVKDRMSDFYSEIAKY